MYFFYKIESLMFIFVLIYYSEISQCLNILSFLFIFDNYPPPIFPPCYKVIQEVKWWFLTFSKSCLTVAPAWVFVYFHISQNFHFKTFFVYLFPNSEEVLTFVFCKKKIFGFIKINIQHFTFNTFFTFTFCRRLYVHILNLTKLGNITW